jgi:hypothetical protein
MGRFTALRKRTLRSWIRGIGIVIALVGLGALPLGVGVAPKRDTNFYYNPADTGIFIKYGLLLILIGIAILIGSIFLPPYDDDGT